MTVSYLFLHLPCRNDYCFFIIQQNETTFMNQNSLISSAITLVVGFLVNKFMPGAATWAVPAVSAVASILMKQAPQQGAVSGLLGGGVLGGLAGAMGGDAAGAGIGSLLGGLLGDNGGVLSSLLGGGLLGGAGGGIGGFLQGMINKSQQS